MEVFVFILIAAELSKRFVREPMEKLRVMNRKIQLIWDFRGQEAIPTAQHHRRHLEEYLLANPYTINVMGVEKVSDFYAIAYMVVEEVDMIGFRDALKPHRAQVYEEK